MTRFRRALKSVSWKYAFGELLLIFLGVVIALAASAWWQRRDEDHSARQYLDAVRSDLRSTIVDLDSMVKLDSISLFGSRRMHGFLTSDEVPLPPQDSIAVWLRLVYPRFEPNTASVEQLLQSGDLDLVDDPDLRHKITSYASKIQGAHDQINIIEEIFQIQSGIARERVQTHARWEGSWKTPASAHTVSYDLEAMRNDPVLRAAYGNTVLQQQTHASIMRRVRRMSFKLLKELGGTVPGVARDGVGNPI